LSDKLFLVTPIFPPSVNHYLGYRAVCKGGKGIVIAYTTKEAEKFKEEFRKYAAEEVKKQGWKIENTKDRHHYMDCVFYFDRKDKDEQNYFKVMSDVLNGIAYIDDKNILTRTHRIYYDSENPRIEIILGFLIMKNK
jgi:Holliday junction resolvase RusA-like endonuclease